MTRSFDEQYEWQLQYRSAMTAVLAGVFGCDPAQVRWTDRGSDDDRRRNTDVWVPIDGRPQRVSCRVRRYTIDDEFTLRYTTPGGPSEWSKVWEGFGDFLLYGLGTRDLQLTDWFVGSMPAFRRWAMDYLDRGDDPPHTLKTNRDGTRFVAFSRSAIPDFVVAVDEDAETREACWAIVKNGRDLRAHGHGHTVEWARAWLGLDDQPADQLPLLPVPQGDGPPRPCPSCHDDHPVGTTCAGGWAPWLGWLY